MEANTEQTALESALPIETSDLVITEPARSKIAELLAGTDDEISAVRIFVTGGGCSGMNYGMTFAERSEETDSVVNGEDGFRLLIDPVALNYMRGAEIDYVDDGVSATFVFNNVFKAVGGSGACGGCGGAMH
jgi:iron-sulfur cluster insertion protein